MQEKDQNVLLNENWLNVEPIELERVLKLYGMDFKIYSNLRGKCHSWFYTVLRKKKYLSLLDVKALTDNIGTDTFDFLLERVRKSN